jgi:hypothetical protein
MVESNEATAKVLLEVPAVQVYRLIENKKMKFCEGSLKIGQL